MIKEKYGIIYIIKNKINNKLYIGQTIEKRGFKGRYKFKGEGIERVYNEYQYCKLHDKNYNEHLLKSINKYGFEAFEIIEEFDVAYSKEELDKLEDMYIKYTKQLILIMVIIINMGEVLENTQIKPNRK